MIEAELKKLIKSTIKATFKELKTDYDDYSEKLAKTAYYYAKYKIAKDVSRAETFRRHLRAQAQSLVTIVSIREARRYESMWWAALQLMAKTLILALEVA